MTTNGFWSKKPYSRAFLTIDHFLSIVIPAQAGILFYRLVLRFLPAQEWHKNYLGFSASDLEFSQWRRIILHLLHIVLK